MDKSDILFEKYYEDVLRFLRGLSRDEQLAEELTQETIYRAIKSIHMFKGDSDMRVWLCSIAKNLFFTYCKKQKYVTYGEIYENYEAEEKLFMQILEDRETAFQIHKKWQIDFDKTEAALWGSGSLQGNSMEVLETGAFSYYTGIGVGGTGYECAPLPYRQNVGALYG